MRLPIQTPSIVTETPENILEGAGQGMIPDLLRPVLMAMFTVNILNSFAKNLNLLSRNSCDVVNHN
jgi:hypothetical protein